jgi:hypothetical protein
LETNRTLDLGRPQPLGLNSVGWRVDVRVNPVDPPGALRRLGRRKLELGSLEESRRRGSILVGPPKPAACDVAASSGDGVRHRGRMMAENGGASFRQASVKRGPLGASGGLGLPAPRRPPNPTTRAKSWREPDAARAISPPAPPPLQSSGIVARIGSTARVVIFCGPADHSA